MDSSSTSSLSNKKQITEELFNTIRISDDRNKIEALIHQGAELDATVPSCSYTVCTPLMLAAVYNRANIALALVQIGGVNAEAENVEGWTALNIACEQRSLDTVHALLPYIDVNNFNKPIPFLNKHPLFIAGKDINLEIVLALLPKFNIDTWEIATPLDIEKTPLGTIARFDHPDIIQACLLALSAFEPAILNDVRDDVGNNLLMLATMRNWTAIVHALILLKVDINATNSISGNTALMMVAKMEKHATMLILLDAKANPTIMNKQDQTALNIGTTLDGKFLLFSALSKADFALYKNSANITDVYVSYYILSVTGYQDEMLQFFRTVYDSANKKLLPDLLRCIYSFISFSRDSYPIWYHPRLDVDTKEMADYSLKPFMENGLPAPTPTFLPLAKQLRVLTIHTEKTENQKNRSHSPSSRQ